jgi:hypothetical protein
MSIVSGAANPQIGYSALDNAEMVSYIRNGYACVIRKLGDGAYGPEIQVAQAGTASIAAIAPIADSREHLWIMALSAADGTVSRYHSGDSGKTWSLDS